MPYNQIGLNNHMRVRGDYNDVAGNQTTNVYVGETDTVLPRLKATLNPFHLSGADQHTCLEGTRTRIQNQISEFIDNANCESNVAFLLGGAGTGKSTIASTVADNYYEKSRLGCHIFFIRGKSDPNTVIRTIAYNLAAFNSSIALSVENNIKNRGDLTSITLRTQFNILIRKPLTSASRQVKHPVLIVLDALDECGTFNTRQTLLRVLEEGLIGLPPNFRFLITGRPENDITAFLDSLNARKFNLNDIPDDNKKDVCTYITHEFGLWRKMLRLPVDWPWDDNMKKLGEAADGLFIWASTAIKFVFEGRLNRNKRLNRLVNNARALDLNELYMTVLENSFEWDEEIQERFASVFSLVLFGKSPLSDAVIDDILGIESGATAELLSCLRSLVSYEARQPVTIYHTSFYDYLVTCKGKGWYVDIGLQKKNIAFACLNKMNHSLRFNICNLESSFLLNEQVSDLQKRIERNILKYLWYICCNWAHHLRETSYTDSLEDQLRTFTYTKILFWFEVLSLTGTFDDYVGTALVYAFSWLGNKNPELSAFLRDAHRQATVFSEAMSKSAPHIYCSFLPLTKDESTVSLYYKDYANPVAHIEYTGNRELIAVIKIIECDHLSFDAMSFSPDGTRIVTASWNGDVSIWDATSGKLTEALKYCADGVTFSPNGDLVALFYSENARGVVAVWGPKSGKLARELSSDKMGSIDSVTFSKSGKYIASGYENGTILIWDVESGRVDGKPLKGHTDSVTTISFSYDGRYLISGSLDTTVILWNVETRKSVCGPLKGHAKWVVTVTFSPTMEYFVSSSFDRTTLVWRTLTGEVIHQLEGCGEAIFSSDGHHILGFDGYNTIKIWNTLNIDEPPNEFNSIHKCRLVAFAPDGTRFAFVSDYGSIEIWDATVGMTSTKQTRKQSRIRSFAVSSSGRYIASGGLDGTMCLWDAVNGKLLSGPWEGHTDTVMTTAFSPDEKLVASGSLDKTVRVWTALSGETVTILEGHTESVTSVAFSPKDGHIASGSRDETIQVWSVERGELALTPLIIEVQYGGVTSLAYSSDGTRIISGTSDSVVYIWNSTTGQLLSHLVEHSLLVNSVACSLDGLIASGSNDQTVRLWNINSRNAIAVMNHNAQVSAVCLSSDGTWILSGSIDGTIYLWNSSTHDPLFDLVSAHNSWINPVSFLPDKKHFASSSSEGAIKIWSMGDVEWDLRRKDGWIKKENKLIMWFPKGTRETLITPRNPIIMNASYETRVDFSRYLVGNEWTNPIAIASK